jgi:DNA-directed RNA polymerase specialized sigma24 family protein
MTNMALPETDEGKVMKMRALGYSQEEIADRLGVSQSAISQRIQKIRRRARETENDDQLFWELLIGLGAAYLLKKLLE